MQMALERIKETPGEKVEASIESNSQFNARRVITKGLAIAVSGNGVFANGSAAVIAAMIFAMLPGPITGRRAGATVTFAQGNNCLRS
jgi:uncharacterized membrane protein